MFLCLLFIRKPNKSSPLTASSQLFAVPSFVNYYDRVLFTSVWLSVLEQLVQKYVHCICHILYSVCQFENISKLALGIRCCFWFCGNCFVLWFSHPKVGWVEWSRSCVCNIGFAGAVLYLYCPLHLVDTWVFLLLFESTWRTGRTSWGSGSKLTLDFGKENLQMYIWKICNL